jgi:hypothetical protein
MTAPVPPAINAVGDEAEVGFVDQVDERDWTLAFEALLAPMIRGAAAASPIGDDLPRSRP